MVLAYVPLALFAQAEDKAYMTCTYSAFFISNPEKPKVHDDEMSLAIGKDYSRFYSVWEDSIEHVRNRIFSAGGSLNEASIAIKGIPRSYQFYSVEKFFSKKKLFFLNRFLINMYRYEEPMKSPEWEIEPVRGTVAGYNCQKAKARFRGRDWSVWFTPEIPVSDGPWKLWGLPGLILKAEDAEKQYVFECIEIRQYDPPVPIHKCIDKKIVKCSISEYKKMEKECSIDFSNQVFREHGYREPPIPGQKPTKRPYNPIDRE